MALARSEHTTRHEKDNAEAAKPAGKGKKQLLGVGNARRRRAEARSATRQQCWQSLASLMGSGRLREARVRVRVRAMYACMRGCMCVCARASLLADRRAPGTAPETAPGTAPA